MSILRRYKSDFKIYFITNVTYNRLPILINNSDLLIDAFESLKEKKKIDILAFVILPDHFHILIDTKDTDISKIIQVIKMSFGVHYRIRKNINKGRIWQNRFWDHAIRNQKDLNNHLDYIHYNPVKHRYANSPFEWKQSSIHNYLERGLYANDWGKREIAFAKQFGE